jgi:hypothetical protein
MASYWEGLGGYVRLKRRTPIGLCLLCDGNRDKILSTQNKWINFKLDVSFATLRRIKIGKFNTAVSYRMAQTIEGTIGIEGPIRRQSSFLGYSDTEIFELFRYWVMSNEEPPIMSNPYEYCHLFHGPMHSHIRCMLHWKLGRSKADVERILSIQKHFKGIHGTNYRMETIHARAFLHESTRKL